MSDIVKFLIRFAIKQTNHMAQEHKRMERERMEHRQTERRRMEREWVDHGRMERERMQARPAPRGYLEWRTGKVGTRVHQKPRRVFVFTAGLRVIRGSVSPILVGELTRGGTFKVMVPPWMLKDSL